MRSTVVLVALGALAVVAVVVAISTGSVTIPVHALWSYLSSGDAGQPGWTVLLDQIRLPRVATAALAGAGLAVAGLLMQTMFANPLADPYILGVSSGASLGVAVVTLGTGTATTTFVSAVGAGRLSVVAAAAVGSLAVLLLILLLGRWVRSVVTLLILGVMLSSTIGAVVSLFLAFADPARLQRFVLWGLGSYGGVTRTDLLVLSPVVVIGVVTALLLSRSLNALLLGERYAQTMGVNVSLVRVVAVTATALIAGSVTAYCGPIAFLGIAVPHLARLGIGTSDHRVLLPATVLMGITVSVLCSVVAQLPGTDAVLPLNVVTALLGAPVVMVVLLRSRRLAAGAV
ncbi:iron complex transport system permease protein [Microlunatus panaciterrae]|uniref:Iron complex transport system permease protein n=1 Tax=Microlunatus panaciterrae TaxID=400768 RepID=A0ABS2RKK3_9ACTN|nr:iron ABC transporter permease [Microlunatus panaciterrae]MBM7799539.1 iron complex transport system permease protein [Microlunatus panaciterrae]